MDAKQQPVQGDAHEAPAPRAAELGFRGTARCLLDAADVAVRAPGRWPAGFCYQFLALGWAFGVVAALPILGRAMPQATVYGEGLGGLRSSALFDELSHEGWAGLSVLVLVLSVRLAPGLARSFQVGGGTVPVRRTFQAGAGLWRQTVVLWLQVVVTMLAASAITVAGLAVLVAALGLDPAGPLPKVGAGLALAFLLAYGATLGALYHLALASLVRHRRGVGSALLHAWRLVRGQPEVAARAVTLDTLLYGVVAYLQSMLPKIIGGGGLDTFVSLAVLAICGLTRAGFWSRTYARLGGVEPVLDPESGLVDAGAPPDAASA